jgi:hypothetical protein
MSARIIFRYSHIAIILFFIFNQTAPAIDLQQSSNTWIKRSPLPNTPPSPRLGYEGACAWDNLHQVLIRYGGHNQGGGGAQYSEIWTYDPYTAKWILKEPDISPPGVCCAQQNVFDPILRRYVRFPAFSGSHGWQWFREIYLNNSTLWTYDLDRNIWLERRPLPAPQVTGLRCSTWNIDHQIIVIFGGEGNQAGTVVYDPHSNTWTRMRPPREPAFRSSGNMVYDQAQKLHILFGSQFTDDPHTWAYDLQKNRWLDLKPPIMPPTNKNDAVMCYDSINKVVIALIKITQGEGEQARHRLETWIYDTGKNTWTKMKPPQEPDSSSNRARVLNFAPELGLAILENRTKSKPGPPEQQIWTYCYKPRPEKTDLTLLPPTDLKIVTTSNGARLSWKAGVTKGITHYQIYRGTGEKPWEVTYQKIATIDSEITKFKDAGLKQGTIYYYKIHAAWKDRLSESSIKVRTQPPIIEQIVASVLSGDTVKLTWKLRNTNDITGFHVERADVEVWTEDQLIRLKSKVKPLANPSVGAIRRIGNFKRLTEETTKSYEYVDQIDLTKPIGKLEKPIWEFKLHQDNLNTEGKGYQYGVYAYRARAVNALGVESGPSPWVLTIPSAPRWVFSKEDSTTCHLKWAANPENNIQGYRVYRLDGRWEKDTISRLTKDPIRQLNYTDPTAGKPIRRYHIVAVDVLGQEGFPSRPVWFNREWKQYYEPFTSEWHQ